MIGIITVFYSENYGSVLQAYALKKYLDIQGKDVAFINTKNKYSSHSLKRTIMSMGYKMLHLDFKNAWIIFEKYCNFNKTLVKYPYVQFGDNRIDTIVVGSDTVWDVDSKYFLQSQELFWPITSDKVKIISYAASVANSTAEKLKSLQYPIECLRKMEAISVRDSYSYDVITSSVDKKIEVVCDPTLLLHMNDFSDLFVPVTESKYVAVYLFEELEPQCIKVLKKWARERGLKLVSICKQLKWCDCVVSPSVENFVSYIKNANYVITNTFHGTIFSIIFHKQFVCLGFNKKKISEFLRIVGLDNRMFEDKKLVESNMAIDIDYIMVEEKLDKIRKKSYQYLERYVLNNG